VVLVAVAAMTTIQKLFAINTSLVPGPSKDVNRADIKTVLVSNGAYASMKAYVANPGGANQQVLIACNYLLAIVDYEPGAVGPVLATSDPTNLATINALLPGLTPIPTPASRRPRSTPGVADHALGAVVADAWILHAGHRQRPRRRRQPVLSLE
jgi:hypothetical protein